MGAQASTLKNPSSTQGDKGLHRYSSVFSDDSQTSEKPSGYSGAEKSNDMSQAALPSVTDEANVNEVRKSSELSESNPIPMLKKLESSLCGRQLVRAEPLSPIEKDSIEHRTSIDIRLRGNEVFIGGCWGTIDLTAAVELKHKMRSARPPPSILTPSDEVPFRLKQREQTELDLRTLSPERFPNRAVLVMISPNVRLLVLQAIEKVECPNTRKVGLSELMGILLHNVSPPSAKDFLKLMFESRNERLYHLFIPIAAKTVLKFQTSNLSSDLASCLYKLLAIPSAHESASDTCAELFIENYSMLFLLNIIRAPHSLPIQRKGIGICLLKMTSRALSVGFNNGAIFLVRFLKSVYNADCWKNMETEMYACVSLLLPGHVLEFADILEPLTIDCLVSIDSKLSTTILPRSLALSVCTLLLIVGRMSDNNPSLSSLAHRVLDMVSRDNARLLSAARHNRKLLDLIKSVRNVWKVLKVARNKQPRKLTESLSLESTPKCKRIIELMVSQSSCSVPGLDLFEPDNPVEEVLFDSPPKGADVRRENAQNDHDQFIKQIESFKVCGSDAEFFRFIRNNDARSLWPRILPDVCEWLFHVLVVMLGSARCEAEELRSVLQWISESRCVRGIEDLVSTEDLNNLLRYLDVLRKTELSEQAAEMLQYFYSA